MGQNDCRARQGVKRGVVVGVLMALAWAGNVSAEPTPDFGKLATAIYWAEGGAKTAHPYGILTKYRTTTPRQACLNTLRHKYREWVEGGQKGKWLDYLASRYAPVGAANDPHGLNKNWKRNVEYYLGRQA